MNSYIFGSMGYCTGVKSNLTRHDTILTKHARERIEERTCCLNPSKQLDEILEEGVLIPTKNASIIKISNGVFTLICSTETYPYPVITVRNANEYENRISRHG